MSLGHFILEICSNVWSFLSDRAHKEYLYLFKKGARTSVGDADRGNAYVHEIVEHFITEEAHAYNPYIIESRTYTWLRIPLIVEVEHLETFIEGLISLHKEKSCKLTEKCGRLYVTANLGAGPLHFTLCAWGKLFHIEKMITITASLNHCKVNADFSLNAETGRNGKLHSLCIEEFTDVKICIAITGFRYLSLFFSKLFTLMTIFSHRMIRNLVEFELEHFVRKWFPVCQFPIEGRNVNSFSEDQYALSQVEEKSLKCSNTNICGKSSFNDVSTTSNVVSREAVESSFVESGKQIIANANIHNIADCNKEVDSKVKIQLKEKQPEDSEVSNYLERDSWYTNILLQGNEVSPIYEPETSNKSDDNIRIDFAFSKDSNIGDLEVLSTIDFATCCVFVKYEMENLQKMMFKEPNYLPYKHYKRFFKNFLKPIEESEIGETSMSSEQLDEPVLSDENILKNKRSLNSFFKEYPNYIALPYNKCEEKLEVTRPSFESNSFKERNRSESDSKITLEKGNINVFLSTESIYSNITFDRDTEVVKRGELLNSPVIFAMQADKRGMSINRVKNVESILKGTSDSEDTQESKSLDSKKYGFHSYISKPYVAHQEDCSTLIEFLDQKSEISSVKKDWAKSKKKQKSIRSEVSRYESRSTKSNIHRTDRNVEKTILNNSTSLQRENETSKVKTTCTSIEHLNAIGDEICRCFENPWLITIPESTFFFEDNKTEAFSHFTCENKQQASELSEQPGLLKDAIVKRLSKDVDRTIDVDHILNNDETTRNKIGQPATLKSFVKHAAASLDSCTISQTVKNFFEQNPIDNRLLGQNIPLTLSDKNESEQSFSCSLNMDFSGVLKNKLFDLVPDKDKKSYDVLEVEMFNVDPLYSSNPTEMTKDNVKQSPYDTKVLNDSLYWSNPMFSDAGFFSSNSVMINVPSENSSNFQDLTEHRFSESSETSPKISSRMKIKTDADGSCYERTNINTDFSAKCDARVCETFDVSRSSTSNSNSDSQLEVNSNIKDTNLSYNFNEILNLAKVKQAVLNEVAKSESEETRKTASHRILIESLKVTKKADDKYDNKLNVEGQHVKNGSESILVFEEAYDRINADILLLLAEDSLDASFGKDSLLGTTDQTSFPRIDIEESRMSYTDVAEEFQTRTESIKYHQESLFDHCAGTLDVFTEIEDEELEYIIEQTNQLELMFENFSQHRGACKINTSTESPLPYRESTLKNFHGQIFKPEYTDDTKFSLRKDNESLVMVEGESIGCIYDASVQDKSPFEGWELVKVKGERRLSRDITVPEMHSVTKGNTSSGKMQDKSFGWVSSEQSVESQRSPWKECKIVDGEGRVPWKKAMQIWAGEQTLFYPDL